jgi:hypothetical protein
MDKFLIKSESPNVIIYKSIIKTSIQNNIITLLEYEYLLNYLTCGNIINVTWFVDIVNKINNYDLVKNIINKYSWFIDNNKLLTIGRLFIDNIKNIKNITFTNGQLSAINAMINFLCDHTKSAFRLFGYAGSGKTTLMVELVSYLIYNKYLKSVVFTSPTNKATNILKLKFNYNLRILFEKYFEKSADNMKFDEIIKAFEKVGVIIEFCTIHKILKYEVDYDENGEVVFTQKSNGSTLNNYELVIIDECSMFPVQMVKAIFLELKKTNNKNGDNYKNIAKVIFAGDPAQLPPVYESSSMIFAEHKYDFPYLKYKKYIPEDSQKNYDTIISNVTTCEFIVLTEVMRNKLKSVNDICYQLRLSITENATLSTLKKFIDGDKVKAYHHKNNIEKIKSDWFKTCVEYHKKNKNKNMILAWTNNQVNTYNATMRKIIFNQNNINTYEIGDILLLSDYCNIHGDTKLHTSEQIKVIDIDTCFKSIEKFNMKVKNSILILVEGKQIEVIYHKVITEINKVCKSLYFCWKLNVAKLINLSKTTYIFTIHEKELIVFENHKKLISDYIKNLRSSLIKKYKTRENEINKFLITPLWKEFNKNFMDPFANVTYGYAITCHKSQGSNYYNIFVDVDDIIKNINIDEAKKCLYTAVTRSENEVHLLVK